MSAAVALDPYSYHIFTYLFSFFFFLFLFKQTVTVETKFWNKREIPKKAGFISAKRAHL